MSESESTPSAQMSKPHIMLMADVPNWIFARHCRMLIRLLSDEFEFDFKLRGESYSEDDYDLIYPLEWDLIPESQIRTPAKYVTGIRSHILWRGRDFAQVVDLLNSRYRSVHAVSRRLTGLFRPYLGEVHCVTHGVDTEFFTATTRTDLSGAGRLRIGWAGNRSNKSKGFEDYVQPLASIPGVELVFCGFHDKHLNLDQMKEFYDSIDCYVCASSVHHEGNNNPLMEAASMERAIITTDNGTVPEYLRDGVNALIVEPELPNFIRAVCELRDDPARRVRLGRAARGAVAGAFEWRDMARAYARFFHDALAGKDSAVRPTVSMAEMIIPGGRVSTAAIQGAASLLTPATSVGDGESPEESFARLLSAKDSAINHRIRQVEALSVELRLRIADLQAGRAELHETSTELRAVIDEREACRRELSAARDQLRTLADASAANERECSVLRIRLESLENECRQKDAVIGNYHRMSKDGGISLYRKILRFFNLWKY